MGNNLTKKDGPSLFSPDELKILEASFRANCAHSEKITQQKLLDSWSNIIDDHLAQCTTNFLFTSGQQRVGTIMLRRYVEPFYIVERGTLDEKLNFLSASMHRSDANNYAIKELETYVSSVFKSYMKMQSQQSGVAYESWKKHGYQVTERSILALAKGLIRTLIVDGEHYLSLEQIGSWLQLNPTFLIVWKEVFVYLYSKQTGKTHKLGNSQGIQVMPVCEGLPSNTHYTPIIDLPHVIFVNSNLPNELRHKWRFLFSSKIMGESFSTMLGKIVNKGPTLFIVEDEDCYIFGGYAPSSWALRPTFVGDDTSVLLTLSPAMRCFNSTGYNTHFQYLNLSQQTMPNGLGMGGQFNYWGLWLDSEYGLGQSSESCTTYRDYVQLSKRKEFRVRNLEVWGIGDEPKSDDDSDSECAHNRSVLDKNLEDRVMLELSGKRMHSDGLREPDLDL